MEDLDLKMLMSGAKGCRITPAGRKRAKCTVHPYLDTHYMPISNSGTKGPHFVPSPQLHGNGCHENFSCTLRVQARFPART